MRQGALPSPKALGSGEVGPPGPPNLWLLHASSFLGCQSQRFCPYISLSLKALSPLLGLPGASQPEFQLRPLTATPTGQSAPSSGEPLGLDLHPPFLFILPLSRLSASSIPTLPSVQILLISQGPDQTFTKTSLAA